MMGSRGRLTAFVGMAMAVAASGCGNGAAEKFVPVAGTVLLQGQSLSVGSVSFRPDSSKGNPSKHIPTAQMNSEGKFELVTAGTKGAPLGWYKVLVFADANDLAGPASRPAVPKWMMHEKYTDPATTPLSVEVVEQPKPGAYNFDVSK